MSEINEKNKPLPPAETSRDQSARNNPGGGESVQDRVTRQLRAHGAEGAIVIPVEIFTDGACSGNPGPGGWGVVLKYKGTRKELSGGCAYTTNNRMELTAAIMGLDALKQRCSVTLYSDSKYLVDAVEKGWVYRWRDNGWMRSNKEKALNPDLWQRLLELLALHSVRFVWVKGHVGHAENERCDRLAVEQTQKFSVPNNYSE